MEPRHASMAKMTMLNALTLRFSLQRKRRQLEDAERLGRQAMADIRRTVGLLDDGNARMAPEPGVDDIGALVDDFTKAGMNVRLRIDGPTGRVSAAEGLALYRITQESLANIAKHAQATRVKVEPMQAKIEPDRVVLAMTADQAKNLPKVTAQQ